MTGVGQLADELRRIGRRAGLDCVGICDAGPFDDARQVIEERKRAGESGGMQFTYRRPERSTDPEVTLPGARALYVGARSYYRRPAAAQPPDPTAMTGPTGPTAMTDPTAMTGPTGPTAMTGPTGPVGRVARYSWQDHYTPLREALGEVAERLRTEGWRSRVLVDDNSLVDRPAAIRAGLGWYGKNANVLVPDRGSWFVLGSVLTDAPIAPLTPVEAVADGCGTCRRCLSDCPTGALVEPGHLDARRCLAWLVQAPGPFPVEFRRALGDRLYGCDECQERCPVNRKALASFEPEPAGPGSQPWLAVAEVLGADDAELEHLVGRWYIPGREMRYVRRNALVVLGNIGDATDPVVEATLTRYLGDPDPLLRGHAVWAAGQMGRADLLAGVEGGDPFVADELARARR